MSHDETGFAEFFRASWDPCLRAVAASTGDLARAEDQLAEAFARAWASWRKVTRHPAPRAWVVHTALNAGASWWRRRARELPLIGHDVAAPGRPVPGLDTPLLTAVRRLPARQGTVRAHLSRAVMALRTELANTDTPEADACSTTIR